MNLSPVNFNTLKTPNFGHGHSHEKSPYSIKEKAVIAGMTALGVGASLALLAKGAGYSLKPQKMFKNFKNSYFYKVDFEAKEIISIGAGTCLGGLAGGYMVDKNKENRKAKRREAVMQIGNISIPILTVHYMHKLGEKYGKAGEAVSSIAGIFLGVFLANFLMNKLSNVLFKNKNERGVKATDFSAHVDDMLVAATYISKDNLVHKIGRIIPFALMIPGNEVGNKVASNNYEYRG